MILFLLRSWHNIQVHAIWKGWYKTGMHITRCNHEPWKSAVFLNTFRHKYIILVPIMNVYMGYFGSHFETNDVWQLLIYMSWWRHQMEIFSALQFTGHRWQPPPPPPPTHTHTHTHNTHTQTPVTRSFGALFDLRLNKRLSKQSWGWWFEAPSLSIWRHCNVINPIKSSQ